MGHDKAKLDASSGNALKQCATVLVQDFGHAGAALDIRIRGQVSITSDYESEGRTFESFRARHFPHINQTDTALPCTRLVGSDRFRSLRKSAFGFNGLRNRGIAVIQSEGAKWSNFGALILAGDAAWAEARAISGGRPSYRFADGDAANSLIAQHRGRCVW